MAQRRRPAAGDGRWIALEHELWTYAARNEARDHLARRYRAAWAGVDEAAVGGRGRRPAPAASARP